MKTTSFGRPYEYICQEITNWGKCVCRCAHTVICGGTLDKLPLKRSNLIGLQIFCSWNKTARVLIPNHERSVGWTPPTHRVCVCVCVCVCVWRGVCTPCVCVCVCGGGVHAIFVYTPYLCVCVCVLCVSKPCVCGVLCVCVCVCVCV